MSARTVSFVLYLLAVVIGLGVAGSADTTPLTPVHWCCLLLAAALLLGGAAIDQGTEPVEVEA